MGYEILAREVTKIRELSKNMTFEEKWRRRNESSVWRENLLWSPEERVQLLQRFLTLGDVEAAQRCVKDPKLGDKGRLVALEHVFETDDVDVLNSLFEADGFMDRVYDLGKLSREGTDSKRFDGAIKLAIERGNEKVIHRLLQSVRIDEDEVVEYTFAIISRINDIRGVPRVTRTASPTPSDEGDEGDEGDEEDEDMEGFSVDQAHSRGNNEMMLRLQRIYRLFLEYYFESGHSLIYLLSQAPLPTAVRSGLGSVVGIIDDVIYPQLLHRMTFNVDAADLTRSIRTNFFGLMPMGTEILNDVLNTRLFSWNAESHVDDIYTQIEDNPDLVHTFVSNFKVAPHLPHVLEGVLTNRLNDSDPLSFDLINMIVSAIIHSDSNYKMKFNGIMWVFIRSYDPGRSNAAMEILEYFLQRYEGRMYLIEPMMLTSFALLALFEDKPKYFRRFLEADLIALLNLDQLIWTISNLDGREEIRNALESIKQSATANSGYH